MFVPHLMAYNNVLHQWKVLVASAWCWSNCQLHLVLIQWEAGVNGLGSTHVCINFSTIYFFFSLKFIECIYVWVYTYPTRRPPMGAPFMSPILANLTSRWQ